MAKVRKVSRRPVKEEEPSLPEENEDGIAAPGWLASAHTAAQEYCQSPQIHELAAAFAKFRETCVNPKRDKEGYNYRYTTLANVIESTKASLAENGLSVVQFPTSEPGALGCITVLMHSSGQFIQSRFVMPIPALQGTNATQDAGAAITYARRYALSAVLCLASDDDTDAVFEEAEEAEDRPRRRKKRAS